MTAKILFSAICLLAISCSSIKKVTDTTRASQGDPLNSPSYGYTPIDPLPADIDTLITKPDSALINLFSDETMRLAIGSRTGNANFSYGRSSIGLKGQSYIVVLDYIKYVTVPFQVYVWRGLDNHVILTTQSPWDSNETENPTDSTFHYERSNIVPLYVGVGLRITADVTIISDSINLDLFGLGFAASSGKVSGSLVVQTLGITGENISSLLPMPSQLNQTTIQNAIVALGAIRAKLYERNTILAPRVLGFYNNIGGNGMDVTTNVISKLLYQPIIIKKVFVHENADPTKK
jgi:hypothetical protein